MRAVVGVCVLLAIAGCRQSTVLEPEGATSVLLGVVVSGADSVFVVVGAAGPGGPVATVSEMELRLGAAAVPMEPGADDGCGHVEGVCFRGEIGGAVEPGHEIELFARLADGRTVSGRTMTPLVPALRVGDAEPGDTVRGRIQDRFGGFVPQLLGLGEVSGRVASPDTEVPATVWAADETLACVVHRPIPVDLDLREADRVGVAADEPVCPGRPDLVWDSLTMPATFMVYDDNFTAWMGERHAILGGRSFGLDGMLGVFGAATPVTFIIFATP